MGILIDTLNNLDELFIYNNNHYKNIYENLLILYYNLKNTYKIHEENIGILSKNNKYYLDFMLLSLIKPLSLHNLTNIDDPEYYKNIISENNIKVLIIDKDFKNLIPADVIKDMTIIFCIDTYTNIDKGLEHIKSLYNTDGIKKSEINYNKSNKFDKSVININYYTTLKSPKISIKSHILEYQIANIAELIKSNIPSSNSIKWLHNIPLFNPISLSYILAINLLEGHVFINTLENDVVKLCNEYDITHLRFTQTLMNNNATILKTLVNPTVIFCELKKTNILEESITMNNIQNLHIIYDIILLNMYGPILYSNTLNTYTDINTRDKYIIHELFPCKNIIMKNKNRHKNSNIEEIDPLIKKFLYIKINVVYDKWIKLNYNYIFNNDKIYLVNYRYDNLIENKNCNEKSIILSNIYHSIIYVLRYLVIFVIYYIKCKISNYIKSNDSISQSTEVIYLLEFNKTRLEDFCLENEISIKHLLLSIYINVIGKYVDNGLVRSYVNETDMLNYNDININSDNIPIYFLPIEYNIKNIVKYVKILEKEYELSYAILKSLKSTPLRKISNLIEENSIYGFNYKNTNKNTNNLYKETICNLNIFIIEDKIKFIFNHRLCDKKFIKIIDYIKYIISLI